MTTKNHRNQKTKLMKRIAPTGTLLLGSLFVASGCGSSATNPADTSGTSTMLSASTVGGAVSNTGGDSIASYRVPKDSAFASLMRELSPIKEAFAAFGGACPTIGGGAGGGQCSLSGNAITLTFPSGGCTYAGIVGPIWIGGTVVNIGGTAPTGFMCGGTYPTLSQSDPTLTRTYLGNLLSSPSARTNALGSQTVVVDTSAPTATTFAGALSSSPVAGTIGYSYSIPAGGGYERQWISNTSHNLSISVRLVGYAGSSPSGTVNFDHTLSTTNSSGTATPLNISRNLSGPTPTETVNGTLNLQHNLMKITATSTFNSVEFQKGCCYPISGNIVTNFTSGGNSGLSETMSFNSGTCALGTLGEASFTDVNGKTSTKTLTHCF